MYSVTATIQGAKRVTSTNYAGRHRALEMSKGIGYIPLGDRSRVVTEFGVDFLEERDSLDKYSKYATE